MKFEVHSDPAMDLGGKSNVPRKNGVHRLFIRTLKCSLLGHTLRGTGNANGHAYSWLDWRIGRYQKCFACQCRIFDLETREQLNEVLQEEQTRWTKYFKAQSA